MKESGTTHWSSPNTNANNSSGFTGLPGGIRFSTGPFILVGRDGYWWCSTEDDTAAAWFRMLGYDDLITRSNTNKRVGFSVRCLIDAKPQGIVAIKPQTQINSETIIIGKQTWMKKNLDVSKFRNGDIIPEVRSQEEWSAAALDDKPAWCYYDNDPANGLKYGKLYNWAAVNDPRGLAPEGWHVPSAKEWLTLRNYLGGKDSAGTKMKSNSGWMDNKGKNGNGTNTSGFTGLPGGSYEQNFYGVTNNGMWWSSTEESQFYAWRLSLHYHSDGLSLFNDNKEYGLSVRCVKD